MEHKNLRDLSRESDKIRKEVGNIRKEISKEKDIVKELKHLSHRFILEKM